MTRHPSAPVRHTPRHRIPATGCLSGHPEDGASCLGLSAQPDCEDGVHAFGHQPHPATDALLADCLAFDHVAAGGSIQRRSDLSGAAQHGRMRVAVSDGDTAGYSVVAPWFFGAPFLALVYVKSDMRGQGIGSQLLGDFERAHGPQVFTSTNLSNARIQRLLRRRLWTPCGMLNGLDKDDPEIFFDKYC